MKNNLFVVSTHFQLLNVINIVFSIFNNDCNDVIIFKINDKSEEMYKVCNDSKLFNNVDVVDIGNQYEKQKIKYFFKRVSFVKHVGKVLPLPRNKYDSVFLAGTEIFSKAVYAHYYKHDKTTNLIYYEDGTGSYSYLFIKKNRKMIQFISLLLLGFNSNKKCSALYVYEPDLVHNDYDNIKVMQLPKIAYGTSKYDFFKNLYVKFKGKQDISQKKIIILDSNFEDSFMSNFQKELFRKIIRYFPDTIIKLHPSSENNKYGDDVEYWETKLNFESEFILNDLYSKTLVSVYSSASITSKFVFDSNVNTFFVYKIVDPELNRFYDSNVLVEKLINQKGYKIVVPETEEELFKQLEKCYK